MATSDQIKIEAVVKNCGQLIEGPHWHAASQTLYFVDFLGNAVHRYRPADNCHEKVNVGPTGKSVAAVVTTASGNLLLAAMCRFAYLDWATGALTTVANVDADKPENRFNDGKCDAKGRFWAGTMGTGDTPTEVRRHQGSLYCLHTDKSVTKHAEDVDISNGIAWSLDNKIMYYIDTMTRLVEAFDYNLETGKTSNRRPVITVPEEEGWPDGMCIDDHGMIWLACFSGSRINRYDPNTGKKLQTILFPVTDVTSCCFGGPNLDQLYVTSCRLSDEVVKTEQPLAGSLFRVTGLGVKGFASADFAD